ncbi:MAG TPA: glucoamylase family protein [Gemmataceae bacterium]|nr:glucoamylase family protein [Gemmataceae bacterium]
MDFTSGGALSPADRALLFGLQRRALRYFLDNQAANGLVLDRQANHGPRRPHELCSIAATGMGFVALALASAPPYRLLSPREASRRVAAGLRAALEDLPHDHGVLPHFVHSASGAVYGSDVLSTVDSSWLVAGGLWAAGLLRDPQVESLAARLASRVDYSYWATPAGLLRHGRGRDGRLLDCCWDRVNGETAFMYVLAAGADDGRALGAASWQALRPFRGTTAGHEFNNADLGLFVFQYGLDLLDLRSWRRPGDPDLWAEARTAALANEAACRAAAGEYATYRRFWGLSAGDGPPAGPGRHYDYRSYSPSGPIDGTAHLTATLASVEHHPAGVLRNLRETRGDGTLLGRYGFSNVNLDRGWVARDMVGIDAGAAVLALDNVLTAGRVREVFHALPCVGRAMERLGFVRATPPPEANRQAS